MGRPVKLTPEVRDKIIELSELGLPLAQIAAAVGLHRTTITEWDRRGQAERRGRFSDFSDALARARAALAEHSLRSLRTGITQGTRRLVRTRTVVRHPQSGEIMRDAHGNPIVDVTEREELSDPDPKLSLAVLGRILPDDYGRNVAVNHAGNVDFTPRRIVFVEPDGSVIKDVDDAEAQAQAQGEATSR